MRRLRRHILCVCIAGGAGAILVLTVAWMLPLWRFKRVVLDPVPRSVKAIKMYASRGINDRRHVFRFEISRVDLLSIVDTREFKRVGHVRYDNGMLIYGEDSRVTDSFYLYDTYIGKRPPRWFKVGRRTDFESYIVEDDRPGYYRVFLLLYEKDSRQAYFIEHEVKGIWNRLGREELRRKLDEDVQTLEEALDKR